MSNDYRPPHNTNEDVDAGVDNTSTGLWGNSAEWSWPSDLQEQRVASPPQSLPTPVPHYHRQLPPLSHTNPIASLNAALRGEDPTLPHYSAFRTAQASSAAPTPTRPQQQQQQQPAARHRQSPGEGTLTYLPDYLFYSPPGSPDQVSEHEAAVENTLSNSIAHQENGTSSSGPSNRPATPRTVASSLSLDSSPSTMPRARPTSTRKRQHAPATIVVDDSPKVKRRKLSGVPQVDLSIDDDIEEAIKEKEREDLVKRQREESKRPVKINDLTCMICLEHFTNLSVTHCGHIFCHECLTQALNASERASERHVGTCPACRKPIKRTGAGSKTQIIPLALMKKPREQKRGTTRRPSKLSMDEV